VAHNATKVDTHHPPSNSHKKAQEAQMNVPHTETTFVLFVPFRGSLYSLFTEELANCCVTTHHLFAIETAVLASLDRH